MKNLILLALLISCSSHEKEDSGVVLRSQNGKTLDRNGKWVQVKFPPNDSVYVIEAKADIIQCKTEKDLRRIIDSLKRENKR